MEDEFSGLFFNGEFKELVGRFEDMLKRKEQYFFDVSELESIIDYYMDVNKSNNALHAVHYASKLHPGAISFELKRAQVYVDKDMPQKSLDIIERIEPLEYGNSDVFLIKGTALTMLSKYDESKTAFDIAVELAGDEKVDVLHTIANEYEQIGKYQTSLDYLEQAYGLEPRNMMLIYDIGYTYEKLGKIDKSIEYYKKYLDIEPFSDSAWYNLGALYQKIEMLDEAIDAYEYTLAINPHFSIGYYQLGTTWMEKEVYENAIKAFVEYLEQEQNNSEAFVKLGDCYKKMSQWADSYSYYQKALAVEKDNVDAYFGLATVLFEKKEWQEALLRVQKAIELENMNGAYYALQGDLYLKIGDSKNALRSYYVAIDIAPDNLDYLFTLTDLYKELGILDKALQLLQDGLLDFPREAAIYFRIGGCFLLSDQEHKALPYIEKGLEISPKKYTQMVYVCPKAMSFAGVKTLVSKYLPNP